MDYKYLSRLDLVHQFAKRVPDLYMDMVSMALGMSRHQLVQVLELMDADAAEGKKGRLQRLPFTPDPDEGTGTSGAPN